MRRVHVPPSRATASSGFGTRPDMFPGGRKFWPLQPQKCLPSLEMKAYGHPPADELLHCQVLPLTIPSLLGLRAPATARRPQGLGRAATSCERAYASYLPEGSKPTWGIGMFLFTLESHSRPFQTCLWDLPANLEFRFHLDRRELHSAMHHFLGASHKCPSHSPKLPRAQLEPAPEC